MCVCVFTQVQQRPASLPVCLCACVCVCVCDISSSSLHSFLVKAIGDQWRLKVTNHRSSPTLPYNSPKPHFRPLPSPPVLTLSPRRQPLGARVSFVFGAMVPVEGLQGIRGSGGQLLLCFNWHYHFSRLTEMDHPAGPCYCWYRSRGGVEAGGEGRRGIRCWPGGHDEREDKGRRKCRWKRGAQNEGRKQGNKSDTNIS